MNRDVLRVCWYRFRATFGVRWRGYVALALLIGVLGGVAMGSIGAGRRTQSSYPRFLASTSPSDLNIPTFPAGGGSASAPSPAGLTNTIAGVPGVKRVETYVGLNIDPLGQTAPPSPMPSTQSTKWQPWEASTACSSTRTGSRSSTAASPTPTKSTNS